MKSEQTHCGTTLITGGARRIGRAIALALATRGYQIALHYNHSKKDAIKTCEMIKNDGGSCTLYPCALDNEEKTKRLIKTVQDKQGGLSLLVNNASIFEKSSFKKSFIDSLHKNLKIHLIAPYILSQEFAKHCHKGQIINILDTRIINNQTQYFDYLLTKKSLMNLTLMMAVSLAPKIRVNAIAPGLILPPNAKKEDYLERLSKSIPLKQKGDVKHIINSVNYITDNTFLTGQILFNDGGEHLL